MMQQTPGSYSADSCSAAVVYCTSRLISDARRPRSTCLFATCGCLLTQDTIWAGANFPRCQLIQIPWQHPVIIAVERYFSDFSIWFFFQNNLAVNRDKSWFFLIAIEHFKNVIWWMIIVRVPRAVQLLHNALGRRGSAMVWHFVTGGGGVGRALHNA